MILTVTPNPCVDKTVFIDRLTVGAFIRSGKCTCIPGGKGANVSRAVKALGRPTKAMAIVGGHPGRHVVDMIEQQDGVKCIPAWVESQTRTITTVLEEPVHRQTAFFEPGSRVTSAEYAAIVAKFQEAVAGAHVVTFNGTVCDKSIKNLYRDLIPIAKQAGATTILDSHGPEFALGLESVPYMVKPNVAETEEVFGYSLETDHAKWQAIAQFHAGGIELVALSLGERGAFVSRGNERFHVVPPKIAEVNPVGSGDAFVAAFAIGLLENMSLRDMAMLGCAAGAANAMNWDIGHFTKEEVETLMPKVEVRPFKMNSGKGF
ncbi:MAG TPA: hexose kinase [Candidatus Hydrogenedentes bacterium]|nr:hexose kinase [Candidatus Hydrogenedentota bacterium]HQH50995.1 hexose kinase [Candidatus Hydrogenedentota bacterium]